VIKPRRMSSGEHSACIGEIKNALEMLVGKHHEKRPPRNM
jgi:hypothetical protein